MKKLLTTNIVLLSIAMLLGCNSSSTDGDSTTGTPEQRTTGPVNTPVRGNATAGQQDSHLDNLLQQSDAVFLGVAKEATTAYAEVPGQDRVIPFQAITYEVQEVFVGSLSGDDGTFTVIYPGGGTFDGHTLSISHEPENIRLEEEAVLFVKNRGDNDTNLVNYRQGRFVKNENGRFVADNGKVLVYDEASRRVQYYRDVRLAKSRSLKDLSSDAFGNHLRELDSRSARKGARAPVQNFQKYEPFRAPKGMYTASRGADVFAKTQSRSKPQTAEEKWEEDAVRANGGSTVLYDNFSRRQ